MVDDNNHIKCQYCGHVHGSGDEPSQQPRMFKELVDLLNDKPGQNETLNRLQHYRNTLADAYDALSSLAYWAFMDGRQEIAKRANALTSEIINVDRLIDEDMRLERKKADHVA
ncbi:hypothetical protein [Bifidobacterium aerophilum]|uniref:Uncharacterized protein n=1 Tax=Bifidobacterium aerophilum TaxID=1798155 RepID=A0A6N9Z7I6_9BIFI|nr:hypothetical protein [Bifidobacterium aerophilum]NEG90578.1 hypothetical protein [Bifidobacterium aerophilum]